jgi:integrase
MASVCNDPNGRKRITFKGLDGVRRTLHLGKASERTAGDIRRHVNAILSDASADSALDPRTAEWLAKIGSELHKKLVAVGLVNPREAAAVVTLEQFLTEYVSRRTDVKESSRVFYGLTVANLKAFFGTRALDSIIPAEADDFRRWLVSHEKLSPATVARRCSMARTFFRDAVRRRLIPANPFDGVGGGPKNNPARSVFIDRETISKVLDACPNASWRCLVALSRFGGLRVPSEALMLRWQDINWGADRFVIPSPKTEHHGKASRVCPIFPELHKYLDELYSAAPEGAVYVLDALRPAGAERGDWQATNLRTQFERIITRAGLKTWERLWHNLRASRQTELVEDFPAHVVAAWLGNTERVARQHYLQVLDSHFEKAARQTARQTTRAVSESTCNETHGEPESAKTPCFQGVSQREVGPARLELATKGL